MNVIYWLLVFLCAAQRLLELSLSRNNRNRLESEGFEYCEKNSNYFCMLILHNLWFLGIIAEPLIYESDFSGPLPAISLAFFITAQALRFWTLKTLGKHWNTMVMAPGTAQQGTFVSNGPYKFIRHPNYLVVIIELASLPLIAGAYYTALLATLFNGLILYRRIVLEEKYLFSRPMYQEKMGNKSRFIPGIF